MNHYEIVAQKSHSSLSSTLVQGKISKFSRVNIKIAKRCKMWWLTLNILRLTVLRSYCVSISSFRNLSTALSLASSGFFSVHSKRRKNWEANIQKALAIKCYEMSSPLSRLTAHIYLRSTTLLLRKQHTTDLLYLGYKYGKWTFFYFSRFEVVDKFRFNWVSSR